MSNHRNLGMKILCINNSVADVRVCAAKDTNTNPIRDGPLFFLRGGGGGGGGYRDWEKKLSA